MLRKTYILMLRMCSKFSWENLYYPLSNPPGSLFSSSAIIFFFQHLFKNCQVYQRRETMMKQSTYHGGRNPKQSATQLYWVVWDSIKITPNWNFHQKSKFEKNQFEMHENRISFHVGDTPPPSTFRMWTPVGRNDKLRIQLNNWHFLKVEIWNSRLFSFSLSYFLIFVPFWKSS